MLEINRVEKNGLVCLKTSKRFSKQAMSLLPLAEPLQRTQGEWQSLWLGPDEWLLTSDTQNANELIKIVSDAFGDATYSVVDVSGANELVSVRGHGVRELLSSGCGLDFRPERFPINTVQQTRFAQIPMLIVAMEDERYELMFDYSLSEYMATWLNDSTALVARAQAID